MGSSLQWKGTSLRIPISKGFDGFIEDLEKESINISKDTDYYRLENQCTYFIEENDFLLQSNDISTNLIKFSEKNYDGCLKVYSKEDNAFSHLCLKPTDKDKYVKTLENNILDGFKRKITVSPNVLNEILNDSPKSRIFLDILILMFIANKSVYDAETIESEFKAEDKSYKIKLDINSTSPLLLYPIYSWIINDTEYESSIDVKLQIARQVIAIKNDITKVDEILEDCNLCFKRIVSRKTNDYFEQINKLKDDFLIMSRNEGNALRTLNLTFFAWLGYIGVELFNIIKKYDGDNILEYLLFSKGAKKGIVILLFTLALCFIFLAYYIEINGLKKTYRVVKETYEKRILFESSEDKKFDNLIEKPRIGVLQLIVFIALIFILLTRLCVTFPW